MTWLLMPWPMHSPDLFGSTVPVPVKSWILLCRTCVAHYEGLEEQLGPLMVELDEQTVVAMRTRLVVACARCGRCP